jgi:hypothetical protein
MENRAQPAHPPQSGNDSDWIGFPGGELEGKRPKALCPACREALGRVFSLRGTARRVLRSRRDGTAVRPLCFQCYRAEIDRDRALKACGELDTASVERFQTALPFEPIDGPRLEMLKIERTIARGTVLATASGQFADRRRQAQIAARHALQRIAAMLPGNGGRDATRANHARAMSAAIHAAELQLPESWLPFVVSG